MKYLYVLLFFLGCSAHAQEHDFTVEHDFDSNEFKHYSIEWNAWEAKEEHRYFKEVDGGYRCFIMKGDKAEEIQLENIETILSRPTLLTNYEFDMYGLPRASVLRYTIVEAETPASGRELVSISPYESKVLDVNIGIGDANPVILYECKTVYNEIVSLVFSAFDGEKRRVYVTNGHGFDMIHDSEETFKGVVDSHGTCSGRFFPYITFETQEQEYSQGIVRRDLKFFWKYANNYHPSELIVSTLTQHSEEVAWSPLISVVPEDCKVRIRSVKEEISVSKLIVTHENGDVEEIDVDFDGLNAADAEAFIDYEASEGVKYFFYFPGKSHKLFQVRSNGIVSVVEFPGVLLGQSPQIFEPHFLIQEDTGNKALVTYKDGIIEKVYEAKELHFLEYKQGYFISHGITTEGVEFISLQGSAEDSKDGMAYLANNVSELSDVRVDIGADQMLYVLSDRKDGTTDLLKIDPTRLKPKTAAKVEPAIYPNPIHNSAYLNVKGIENTSYQIIDITGKQFESGTITPLQKQISVAGIPSGTYYLTMNNETFKFVILD